MSNKFLKRLQEDPEYFEFWQDLREYSKDLDIPNKMEFVETLPILFKKIENDGAGYYIQEGLNKYAEKKPKDGVDLLRLIEKKSTKETLSFSASLLSGLSKSKTSFDYKKTILQFLGSKDVNKISAGVDAAYRSVFANEEEETKFLKKVHNKLQKV